jgi:hypothetical protein
MTEETRICRTCQQDKPLTEYYVRRRGEEERQGRCKSCQKLEVRRRYDELNPTHRCSHCHQIKPLHSFRAGREHAGRLCFECSQIPYWCRVHVLKKKYLRVTVTEKRCARCHQTRPATDFPRSKQHGGGLYSYCRTCTAAIHQERRRREQKCDAAQEVRV